MLKYERIFKFTHKSGILFKEKLQVGNQVPAGTERLM